MGSNLTSNPAIIKAGKEELADVFLHACSYTTSSALTRRRQPELVVSHLKFPQHIIPVASGTANIPTYPQTNGLDMNELVQVAQDTHRVPYTIETLPYLRQEYNPFTNQITITTLEYPTLLPSDRRTPLREGANADAPRWVLDQNIFGYFVLNPFTLSFSPLAHQAFVNKAAKNEPKFDSNGLSIFISVRADGR